MRRPRCAENITISLLVAAIAVYSCACWAGDRLIGSVRMGDSHFDGIQPPMRRKTHVVARLVAIYLRESDLFNACVPDTIPSEEMERRIQNRTYESPGEKDVTWRYRRCEGEVSLYDSTLFSKPGHTEAIFLASILSQHYLGPPFLRGLELPDPWERPEHVLASWTQLATTSAQLQMLSQEEQNQLTECARTLARIRGLGFAAEQRFFRYTQCVENTCCRLESDTKERPYTEPWCKSENHWESISFECKGGKTSQLSDDEWESYHEGYACWYGASGILSKVVREQMSQAEVNIVNRWYSIGAITSEGGGRQSKQGVQ